MKGVVLRLGDCRDVLAKCKENCVDSVVVDPPYGLSKEPNIAEVLTHWLKGDDYKHTGNGFMGKSWDSFVPGPATWKEVYRVLKPGGYLLCFAGSRTVDLMGVSLRLAGFEIRDQIMWCYGSGFPKSLDISKALDKKAGVEREVLGVDPVRFARLKNQINGSVSTGENWEHGGRDVNITAPATEEAQQWQGWGTALKPAHEPIIVCRKPIGCATIAANVLMYGTGGLNIDGCRVELNGDYKSQSNGRPSLTGLGDNYDASAANQPSTVGRFPANLVHDGSDEVLAAFPDAAGQQGQCNDSQRTQANCYGATSDNGKQYTPRVELDKSAARFFYCAKASKSDRGEGNNHPTVKPQALMRYLVRLVTPPGGIVLDCFMGSGSTGKAAVTEGFKFFGITDEVAHLTIAERRIRETAP